MSRTAKPAKFEMRWFPNEGLFSFKDANRYKFSISLPCETEVPCSPRRKSKEPLSRRVAFPSPDEGKTSSDSLVLGLRNW